MLKSINFSARDIGPFIGFNFGLLFFAALAGVPMLAGPQPPTSPSNYIYGVALVIFVIDMYFITDGFDFITKTTAMTNQRIVICIILEFFLSVTCLGIGLWSGSSGFAVTLWGIVNAIYTMWLHDQLLVQQPPNK